MHRPDVDSIVNCAADAGREGELIFRLGVPASRLQKALFSPVAVQHGGKRHPGGFSAHLKPSTEYDALYNAALCRERADWMVGINASRLFSCLYGQPLAVGRVMTPVLAMTVVREAAIAAFTPEKFYTVDLELTSGCTASSRRIPEKSVAENLLKACRKEMVATIQRITRKEKSENRTAAVRPDHPSAGRQPLYWGTAHSRRWTMYRACMRRNLPLIPELIAAISPTMTRRCWRN